MEIKRKYYLKDDSLFHVVYRRKNDIFNQEKTFTNFNDFAKYLKKDLSNANLYDFSFNDIDLTKYNIENALIKKEDLEKQNLYDSSFYDNNILAFKDIYKEENNLKPIIISNANYSVENIQSQPLSKNVWYISDLHINHKIFNHFPSGATKEEIKEYIHELINKMIGDEKVNFLLIGGDVSFNFEISNIFYEILSKKFIGPIFVVLGNHELWDSRYNGLNTDNYEEIIARYESMFEQYDIHFLNNSLFCYKYGNYKMFSFSDLQKITNQELKNICNDSYLNIFGGVGFSYYNQEFNADSGIYRNTIKTIEHEKKLTLEYENLYNKVYDSLADYQLICLTHMPKEDWSSSPYNSNWIYVNGHTHKNFYKIDSDSTIYANNQIGYDNDNIHLKSFPINFKFDYFKNYCDGIYKISALEYKMFYAGLRNWIEANRKNGQYYMVKKNNTYCFFWKNLTTNKLYHLEGGTIHTILNQDLEYYYNSMETYSNTIKSMLNDYNLKLNEISKNVKSFGGSGKIHGCIVDIDFYSHIFLNPYDNTITPYYATDIVNKYVYQNVASLLFNNNKTLYLNFKTNSNLSKSSYEIVNKPKRESSTEIYKISRFIYALQRISNFNVIRLWNDNIINKDSPNNQDLLKILLNNE